MVATAREGTAALAEPPETAMKAQGSQIKWELEAQYTSLAIEAALIHTPRDGQVFTASDWAKSQLRFTLAGLPQLQEAGARVVAKLDHFPPRALEPLGSAQSIDLSALMFEWDELSPGPHWVAVLVSGAPASGTNELSVRCVDFQVSDGADGTRLVAPASRLLVLGPSGTYNGADADTVRLDFALLQTSLEGKHTLSQRLVDVTVREPNGSLQQASLRSGSYRLLGLKSGDYRFELRDAHRHSASEALTITVNRDLERR
jgi:hypothetical protein